MAFPRRRDPRFRREATDIYTSERISYVQAILGTSVQADTVDGKVEVKIPAGTQPEQRLRLRGKGVPRLGSDVRGDQYITVKVEIPSSISGKEKDLIKQIAALSSSGGSSSSSSSNERGREVKKEGEENKGEEKKKSFFGL